MGSASKGAPLSGNMEGHYFPRAVERRENVLYLGNFYEQFERCVRKAL
jgi:hypothetical protein